MLDGGLCWRAGKDKGEDAGRHPNSKQLDAEKQRKKEMALTRKRAALADPDLLTANVVVPGTPPAHHLSMLHSNSLLTMTSVRDLRTS